MEQKTKREARTDLKNQRFGRLLVLEQDFQNTRKGVFWKCLCDCGIEKSIGASRMMAGSTVSCGCFWRETIKARNTKIKTGCKFNRLTVLEKDNYKSIGRKYLYSCLCECGSIVSICSGNLKNGHTKSCGCAFQELKGPNHPSWKPNLSDYDREKQRKNKNWSYSILQRDRFTCQICSRKGGRLNAHHKNGWHWCKEGRFDLDNGVSLCVGCHKLFHSIYGTNKNTLEQWNEFVSLAS